MCLTIAVNITGYGLTAKNFGLQEEKKQHLQTAGKDHSLGKRDGVPEKERGRENVMLYEKGG